jgi:hypothetical protein
MKAYINGAEITSADFEGNEIRTVHITKLGVQLNMKNGDTVVVK